MAMVCAVPNWVQVWPSGEMEPEKALPLRSIFTQYGGATFVAGIGVRRSAVGREPPLEAGAVARRAIAVGGDGHVGMGRAGRQALANHDAALGPGVRAGADADDPGDHRAVAAEGLVGIVELIAVVPDVRAGTAQRVGLGRLDRRSGRPWGPPGP